MTSEDSGATQSGLGTEHSDASATFAGLPAAAAADPKPVAPEAAVASADRAAALPAPEEAPAWPSPYLSGGQAIPEAYPAPSQPGQPGYGTAGEPFRSGQQLGSGTGHPGPAGLSQPGYAQPGYRQRVPGRTGMAGRPAPGGRAMVQRDPALAGFGERLLASFLDWLLISTVAFLAVLSPMLRLWHQLELVSRSTQYTTQPAAQRALSNILQASGTVSTLLTFCLIAFGIALAYFWILPAMWGATVGKQVVGLQVVGAADRSRVSFRAAGIRAAFFLLGPAILTLLPQIEILGGILWLADGAVMLMDQAHMQCLHDRLSGTVVIRKRWLDRQQASQTPPW